MSGNNDELLETHVDRSGWDVGPWDGEPDKLVWKTEAGLPGMIARNRSGALCGYVAVTREHPLHGADYDRPDVEVHGGLTYAAGCSGHLCHVPEPGEADDVWWFGFDCNHAWDYAPGDARWRKRYGDLFRQRDDETYRDLGYVRAQVENLASQLVTPEPSSEEKR